MSDTANPANLASSEEFDARLKRTDEPRWLASRYAPEEARQRLVAIYLLHQELTRTLSTKEAMLGKIRIQWWRETVEQIGGKGALRRHDLSEELARLTSTRLDLIAAINDLIDRFDDILDDHLHAGGHQAGEAHEERHLAAEASLARLAGLALKSDLTPGNLDALSRCGEAHLATVAQLPDYHDRWITARVAAGSLPADVWPAIVHLAADAPKGQERSPFSRRWRVFKAMLLHRLGKPLDQE
jgi:phytoene synthase